MKNSKQYATKFTAQVKKLKKQSLPVEMNDPVEVLVYSQLLWESSSSHADAWWSRLQQEKIDWHEVRVSTPDEIAEMCGDSTPLALDRAARIRAMLNHLYHRHHEVTLAPELELGKRDMRDAIESLDGVTPFVSARWLLLCGDIGGVPVDEQLCWMLANADCVDPEAGLHDVAAWVSRQIKAEKAYEVHATLQAWVNGQSDRVSKARHKDAQAVLRAAKKRRSDAMSARAKAQKVAEVKRAEAIERAAARRAAAERAAAEKEAETHTAASSKKAPAKKAAKKAPAKKTAKKTTKKAAAKKTVKKAAKKTAKKTTKKAAAKKTTKKAAKKTTKKTAKKAAAKKTTKKAAKKTAKKSAKKKATKKSTRSSSRGR